MVVPVESPPSVGQRAAVGRPSRPPGPIFSDWPPPTLPTATDPRAWRLPAVMADNLRAMGLYPRAGFEVEDLRRRALSRAGVLVGEYYMALLLG